MPDIRVANAPCSWGVLEFGLEGQTAGYERVLDEMKQAGYVGTELGDWGFMPTEPSALRSVLSQRQLSMLGAFVPVALSRPETHAAGAEVAVRTAQLLRSVAPNAFIVLSDDNGKDPVRTREAGRIQPQHSMSDAEWQHFTRGANFVARQVQEQTGLRTVFHHHCAGFVETPNEIERFLEQTDPSLVSLVLDTGHVTYGGGDPVALLRRHASRIPHVHFKDCHPDVAADARKHGWDYFEAVRRGVFCELGRGSVDFAAVLRQLQAQQYDGWIVVEQDVLPGMGSPLESATRNRQFLKSIGL